MCFSTNSERAITAKTEVLELIRAAFGAEPRPDRFTDCVRGSDRWAHEETLRIHTPETISLEEVGRAGWDPICFLTSEAYRYYFPGLARLALSGGYLGEFLFQLNDDRLAAFSSQQKQAARQLLEYFRDQIPREVDRWDALNELTEKIRRISNM
jgi:hypothetical protein